MLHDLIILQQQQYIEQHTIEEKQNQQNQGSLSCLRRRKNQIQTRNIDQNMSAFSRPKQQSLEREKESQHQRSAMQSQNGWEEECKSDDDSNIDEEASFLAHSTPPGRERNALIVAHTKHDNAEQDAGEFRNQLQGLLRSLSWNEIPMDIFIDGFVSGSDTDQDDGGLWYGSDDSCMGTMKECLGSLFL
mmetsp:Transcript_16942/g.29945  ORF Transcript_16942/g.29945 Transcript_16942/m.29945 type:complete len:189 (+) Transcript_16942:431-997(+)